MQEPWGHSRELAVVDELLRSAAGGHGGALVVTGEPGSGRSELLRSAARLAGGWTVLAAPGYADEAGIPFAGLRRLLGGSSWEAVRAAARERPVLCLVDDAHLLDRPSWDAIRQFARRIGGNEVAVLAAASFPAPGGLPVLPLRPLDDHAAHRLLLRVAPDLSDAVAAGIMAVAAGNPAALTDLAAALTLPERRGFAPMPVGLPPSSLLGQRLRASLSALPTPTRAALLTLALSTNFSDLSDLSPAEAAGLVSISPCGSVRFVPPVLRSVICADSTLEERRLAHLTLARHTTGLSSLTHRAAAALPTRDPALSRELVLAAATAAPPLAALSFRYAAELADDPAGPLLAAARSFWLAGRPDEAVPLLHRAATHAAADGPPGQWPDESPSLPQAAVRARARGLLAEIGLRGDPLPARDALLDVAAELLPVDVPGALSALLLAGEACCRAGDPGRYIALVRRLEAPGPSPAAALAYRQVVGVAALLRGDDEAAFAQFRAVLALAARVDDPALLVAAAMAGIMVGQDRRGASLAGRAAALAAAGGAFALVPAALEATAYAELAAGRYDAATTAALDGAAAARRYGRLDLADSLLALLAVLAGLVGDRPTGELRCREATARHQEARDLTDWAYALLDLVEGQPARAASRLAAIVAAPPGRGSAVLRVAVIPHLVEAAGGPSSVPRLVEPAGAESSLDAPALLFDRWASRTGEAPWLAMRSRCRALRTGDAVAADDHFREALRQHDAGFARAHTELLYGRHLRRGRRHLEARDHLRQAAGTFQLLGAGPWAAQAVRELRAAGERVAALTSAPWGSPPWGSPPWGSPPWGSPPWGSQPGSQPGSLASGRQPGRLAEGRERGRLAEGRGPGRLAEGREPSPGAPAIPALTAQQERIAGLVADGATNREVAQQLHLSPRTVDHHLRNVFARLGVRSRTELARVLRD
ncbi:helix-turn-helix transcriptional regulator [Paractinoplanes globisporus]|uniref:LuxR C-terminal-related transcriptional regulator n=1 Tax=Paractinoplanes globisporus TaxID=113565 RepID=A0ABW6WSH1_9ACTN|nr:LuxR family transcriptional regulator [Actinoplanes globisporus]